MAEDKENLDEVENSDEPVEVQSTDEEGVAAAVAEELTAEEAQAQIDVLIAEQAKIEEVRLAAERAEFEEAQAVEQQELKARQEEEARVKETQDKKLRSLATQIKNLRDEGVDISSLVDDVSDGTASKVETFERRGASLPDQIAHWLEVSTGKPHDGDDVMILDVRADRVQYRFKGLPNISSILRKPNEDLVDPPVHDHEYKVLMYGGQSACTGCGKSNPES